MTGSLREDFLERYLHRLQKMAVYLLLNIVKSLDLWYHMLVSGVIMRTKFTCQADEKDDCNHCPLLYH